MVVSSEFPQPDSVKVRSVSRMIRRNSGVFFIFVFDMLCLLSLYLDVKNPYANRNLHTGVEILLICVGMLWSSFFVTFVAK